MKAKLRDQQRIFLGLAETGERLAPGVADQLVNSLCRVLRPCRPWPPKLTLPSPTASPAFCPKASHESSLHHRSSTVFRRAAQAHLLRSHSSPLNRMCPILAAEERLRLAMLASDVAALDALISPDLVFTTHLGQVVGKQDDLALHRSGVLAFSTLEASEQIVKVSGSLAIVSVRMNVAGVHAGLPFAADLRYTRVWCLAPRGAWQVVAGHISAVQP